MPGREVSRSKVRVAEGGGAGGGRALRSECPVSASPPAIEESCRGRLYLCRFELFDSVDDLELLVKPGEREDSMNRRGPLDDCKAATERSRAPV